MPTRAGRLLTTLVATVAAVVLGVASPAAADTERAAPTSASVSGLAPEDFYEDYGAALDSVDTWWRTHWNEFFTGGYTSPSLVQGALAAGLYDDPAEQVVCGDLVLTGENAWYCGDGDFVAFEIDLMLRSQVIGDAFIYLVVAHEWGHAVAARIDPALVSEAYELQADCLAGAALQGAIDDGLLIVEAGDAEEFTASLAAVASTDPWGTVYVDENGQQQVETHGSAQERISAFERGVANGVRSCLADAA